MSKLFIVTGTTKGLGRALVDALAEDPQNTVIAFSRFAASEPGAASAPEAKPQYLRGVWGENGRNANIYADFTNVDSIESACRAAQTHLKENKRQGVRHSATLINNAGVVVPVGRFDALASAALRDSVSVNLLAPMLLMQWFANATRDHAAQRLIVNISSGLAKRALAGMSAYCAGKAGLEMATRAAALDAQVSDPTMTICSLAPGVVDTPMQANIRASKREQFPEVERFRTMQADGSLRSADAVAREMLALFPTEKFLQLARQQINLDIRTLNAS